MIRPFLKFFAPFTALGCILLLLLHCCCEQYCLETHYGNTTRGGSATCGTNFSTEKSENKYMVKKCPG